MINVLLIDQEFLFQRAFTKMMDDLEGCRLVGVAETGAEAFALLNRFHPQIIFADVMLGQENGIDLCKKIKELFPDSVLYILSNYCNLKLIQKSMRVGIEEYLYKPLSRMKLSLLIKNNQDVKEEEQDEHMEELFSAIDKKDYKKAYDSSKHLVARIFEHTESNKRKEKLEMVATNLIYMIPGMDKTQKNYYLQKYELTGKTLSKATYSYCWVIQIITEVFRQLCVMKYTHMNQVFQYIENNKNYEISLSELSEQAGISSGYLSRIFKKYYHISVVDYIHLRKLHMAKYYMVSSEMNISDISFLLGYSEAGYFCKIFKKYEGMTPSAFHNRYIKQLEAV